MRERQGGRDREGETGRERQGERQGERDRERQGDRQKQTGTGEPEIDCPIQFYPYAQP